VSGCDDCGTALGELKVSDAAGGLLLCLSCYLRRTPPAMDDVRRPPRQPPELIEISRDPLVTVWQALDLNQCQPHGELHDFRGRCPAHNGDNREALHVVEGAYGRCLVHCFVGCETDAVVHALGLEWRDLFPPGHYQNRRRARPRTSPRGPVEIVLEGFDLLGIGVRGRWIADRCPFCDAPGLWVQAEPDGSVVVNCADGCARENVLGALEAQVAIAEASRGAR
jgi:hypothetical protein